MEPIENGYATVIFGIPAFYAAEHVKHALLFLPLDIIIHIHQIPDAFRIIGDIGVTADGVLDYAAGNGKVDHIHGLVVVHHGID